MARLSAWPKWRARLRAALRLPPDDHSAILAALRHDERPLRAAYAPQAHHTVADARERLAEPGDQDRLLWASFEDYARAVFRSQRRLAKGERRLLWQRDGAITERAWRIAGLDFAAIVVRRQTGRVIEIAFVPGPFPDAPEIVVRLD